MKAHVNLGYVNTSGEVFVTIEPENDEDRQALEGLWNHERALAERTGERMMASTHRAGALGAPPTAYVFHLNGPCGNCPGPHVPPYHEPKGPR